VILETGIHLYHRTSNVEVPEMRWHQPFRDCLWSRHYLSRTHYALPSQEIFLSSLLGPCSDLARTFGLPGILRNSSRMPLQEYGDFQFFCTQVLRIVTRDGVQACCDRLSGGAAVRRQLSALILAALGIPGSPFPWSRQLRSSILQEHREWLRCGQRILHRKSHV